MAQQLSAFRTFNESKNLSPRTVRLYEEGLRQFHGWLIDNCDEDAEVTPRTVRQFLVYKSERGNRPTTIRTQVYVLRAFFSFLVFDEIIWPPENPMRKIKTPRTPPPEIRPLSPKEIAAFLDSFDKDNPTSYRDYIACILILDTGLRIGEVVKLDGEDVKDSKINVRGKGGKRRTAYMGRRVKALVEDYLVRCRPWIANGHSALFPTSSGRLRPNYFSELIRRRLDDAGIERMNSSGHRLRHTFAYNFLKAGGNVFALQRLLGHSRLEMTKRYVTLLEDDLAEAHAKASPVDRMELS